MTFRYGSVCSGIEAVTVAWHPFGWRPQFFAEIDAAPRAVLTHHYPEVPLHGDFTTIKAGQYGAIDLLVGGTPCQSFSVAGLRGGLADDRGNLALQYLRLADRLRPRWLVWENVPGVLSSNGGRDFGAILGGMVELGYGFAYRVLDAQYVRTLGFERAVPQRRRRVFVVGCLGDWRRAAAVLLERASLRGDHPPRRETGSRTAVGALAGTSPGGGWRVGADEAAAGQLVPVAAHAIAEVEAGWNSNGTGIGANGEPCPGLMAGKHHGVAIAFDTTQITSRENRNNPQSGDPCHPLAAGAHPPAIAFTCKDHGQDAGELAPTLRAMQGDHANAGGQVAVAYGIRNDAAREGTAKTPSADAEGRARLRDPGLGIYDGLAPTLDAGQPHTVASGWAVRRLTPIECERLQGFPDGYTAVPWRGGTMPDGPRYKALGNSMACNVMRWIGRRIESVEAIGAPALIAAE